MSWWTALRGLFQPSSSRPRHPQLAHLESLIGHRFRDRSLLELALTHRSHANQGEAQRDSYERLEFLGDSVLGMVVAELLYRDHPEMMEGDLTKLKALLVSEATLANVARDLSLNAHLILSADEDRAGGRERASILADALESVIGALYLDAGIDAARRLIATHVYERKTEVQSDDSRRNYKGELLEYLQSRGNGLPRYDVVSETGPDHDKLFTISVLIQGRSFGTGSGSSKKEAEQRAAASALQHLAEDGLTDARDSSRSD